MAQARMDAQRDADGKLWLISSCLLGVTTLIGAIALLLLASLLDPSPPMSRLMGKSPEYVAAYTDTYRAEVKRIRTDNALLGCFLGYGVIWLSFILLI